MNFFQQIEYYCERQKKKPSDLCRKLVISRQYYSKMQTEFNKGNEISKNFAIACGFVLRLTDKEFEKLLNSAGHILSSEVPRDVIIRECYGRTLEDVNKKLRKCKYQPLNFRGGVFGEGHK